MTNYVAIDIGGTNIKYGLIDQDGQLVESHEVATEAYKGGPHILQKVQWQVWRFPLREWLTLIKVRFSMLVHRFRTMLGLNLKKKLKKVSKFLVRLKMMLTVQGLLKLSLVQERVQVLPFA